jgi:transposase
MKYGGGMNELPYPSDLMAAQWALIEPLLPAPKPKGRKRRVDLRKITNAIFYVLKGGISWRMLPREFAPCKTVYHSVSYPSSPRIRPSNITTVCGGTRQASFESSC